MSNIAWDNIAWGRVAALAMIPIVLFSSIGLVFAYHQVPEGHVGVETEWGAVTGNVDDPGAEWKVPFMQGIQDVETRPRTYTMSQTTGEGDKSRADAISVKTVNGTTVKVDVTIRYRINDSEADEFVEDWNNERQMEKRLIRPTIRSELRDEASDIQTTGGSGIYTRQGREALATTARTALESEFADEPIVLEQVQIRNIDLPDQIDATLDEKEQAKQQVEVEQERIRQEEARAEQARVEAQGEADVIATRGEALSENRIVLKARQIEAYDSGTVFVTEGGQEIILDGSGAAEGNTDGNETNSTVPASPGAGA